MRREIAFCRSEKDVGQPAFRCLDQMPQKLAGDRVFLAPMRGPDKHFSEGSVEIPDIAQRDGSYDAPAVQRDPESASARLIEVRDVQEVGLVLDSRGESKLLPLNGKDDVDDIGLKGTGERRDFNHAVRFRDHVRRPR